MAKRLTLKVNTQKKKDKLQDTGFQAMLKEVFKQVKDLVKGRMDSKLDSLVKLGQAIGMDFQHNLRRDYVASYVDNKPMKKSEYCQDMFNLNSVQYDNILIGKTRSIPVELWQGRIHQNFLKPLMKATNLNWSDIDKNKRETLLNPNIPISQKEGVITNIAKEQGLEVLTKTRSVDKGSFSKAIIGKFTEGQLKANPFGKTTIKIPVYQVDKKTGHNIQKDKLQEITFGDLLNVNLALQKGLNETIDRQIKVRDNYLKEQKKLSEKVVEVKKAIA